MPYNYEYSKNLKVYSITNDLDMIGKDGNFNTEADNEEKIQRVKLLLNAVENLSLVVKGNLDNAEPIFAVGGLSDRKTHVFENVVKVRNGELDVSDALCQKLEHGYEAGYLANGEFKNEDEIIRKLKPQSVDKFFENLYVQVENYYKM